ncbi:MAG: PLP-dependent transferase [Pseudomonadota bacterium]
MTRRPFLPFKGAPLVSPLMPAVVYRAETPDALDEMYTGDDAAFVYSREGHPNARHVSGMIDALEGAEGGVMTPSGMAAVSLALMSAAKSGDHVIGSSQLYGRSQRLLAEDLPRLGIATSLFDPTDVASARAAIRPETTAMLIEVVANPSLRVADMDGLIALAKEHGLTVIVDNTFTTPLGYRPLDAGADIVLHSVTKLLSGHSDAMLGWVAARDAETNRRLDIMAATWGFTAAPFDCWLAERGLLSFELRHARTQTNAAALADALSELPQVRRVLYPGRPDHPDHNRARTLLGDSMGSMVSFEIAPDRAVTNAFVEAIDVAFAPTLGDVATTISHPMSSSHREVSEAAREASGISEGFFRVSVGVEPEADLIRSFREALVQL